MGFYKDGKWQPCATEIASGEYPATLQPTEAEFKVSEKSATDTGIELARYAQHLQAKIDSLMLRYCPDEMTPESHQRAINTLSGTDRRD